MNVQQKNKEKGFTIIEVVLVLAIAGLIFLMVFIALPALQRSQRDGQRRDDVSKFVSQLTQYSTNNRGSLPGNNDMASFLTTYMKTGAGEFNDPTSGNAYTVRADTAAELNLDLGEIQYARARKCDGEKVGTTNEGNRQAAVRIKLEGSGYFCQDAK